MAEKEPDYNSDPRGYQEWQREKFDHWKQECHVDNMGTKPVSVGKLLKRTDGK